MSSSYMEAMTFFNKLNEVWKVPMPVKEATISLRIGEVPSVEMTCLVKEDEADNMVEVLQQYRLVPLASWTFMVDEKPPPAYEGEPACYWGWNGKKVALYQWCAGEWRTLSGNPMILHEIRAVLAWQSLVAPPGPGYHLNTVS